MSTLLWIKWFFQWIFVTEICMAFQISFPSQLNMYFYEKFLTFQSTESCENTSSAVGGMISKSLHIQVRSARRSHGINLLPAMCVIWSELQERNIYYANSTATLNSENNRWLLLTRFQFCEWHHCAEIRLDILIVVNSRHVSNFLKVSTNLIGKVKLCPTYIVQ